MNFRDLFTNKDITTRQDFEKAVINMTPKILRGMLKNEFKTAIDKEDLITMQPKEMKKFIKKNIHTVSDAKLQNIYRVYIDERKNSPYNR